MSKAYRVFNVSDPASPGTVLKTNVGIAGLGDFCNNEVYNQAVLGVTLVGNDNPVPANYDTSPKNSILDLYPGDVSPEEDAVVRATGVNGAAGEVRVVHVHSLRWVGKISAISPDKRVVTLDTPNWWVRRQLAENKTYAFEDWSNPANVVVERRKVVRINAGLKQLTLDRALTHNFVIGSSGLIWGLGGLSQPGVQFWVGDLSGPLAYKVYFAHELGHQDDVGDWMDIAPILNLMFGGPYDGQPPAPVELRYRGMPDYYQQRPDENQWDNVVRR
jgi:hypothetical protein